MRYAPLIALWWIFAVAAQQPPPLPEQLDAYFGALADAREFNGTVVVRKGDELLYARAFEMRDSGEKLTLDTPFAVASLTKTFTSGAILKLVQSGKIALDDPVTRFLPEFPNGDAITVRFLLTHAAGLRDPDVVAIGPRRLSSEALIAEIAGQPPLFEPGSEHRYSNAGYNLLARIIEVASGKPYPVYLKETFWELLGMGGTSDGSGADAVARQGHIPGPEGPVPVDPINYTTALGSGSVMSTAPDLGLWLAAVNEKRLFNIFDREWPYGWGKASVLGHDGIEQTGAVQGFVSVMHAYPEERVALVVLSNIENGSWSQWGNDIATMIFGGSANPPLTLPAQPLPDDVRASALGTYHGDGWTASIRNENGFLWAYWNDFPTGKYLKYVGDGRFAVPSDVGHITFSSPSDGHYQVMDWVFPGGGKLSLSRTRSDTRD